jgi:hypothetical protein
MLDNFFKNTKRYIKLFYEAADKVMPNKSINNMIDINEVETVEEVYMNQRMINFQNFLTENNNNSFNKNNNNHSKNSKSAIPPELLRT